MSARVRWTGVVARCAIVLACGACDSRPFAWQAAGPPAAQGAPEPPAEDQKKDPLRCEPSVPGPRWIEEGESVEIAISCATGVPVAGSDFDVLDLPRGARFDPAGPSVSWTPELDQAGVYRITVVARPFGETAELVIGVADRFDSPKNAPLQSAESYTEEFGVPVLHLDPTDLLEDEYRPARVVYRGRTWQAQAKLRGRTSRKYPKRSFTLKFPDDDLFGDAEHGFAGRKRVTLISPFNDNSCVRHRLAFEVWNRMDPNHIPIQCFSVVVFLGGEYQGLYTACDHVDDELIAMVGLEKDGNLYKAIDAQQQFAMSTAGASVHTGYEKKAGRPAAGELGAFEDLDRLIGHVLTASATDFAGGLAGLANQRELEAWWILVTLLHAGDMVRKNYYLYRDAPAGGVFRYVPWDPDGSFGQSYTTTRISARHENDFRDRNLLFDRMLADEATRSRLGSRVRSLLKGPLAAESMLELVDQLDSEVRLVARRDERKWGALYRSFPDWSTRTDFTNSEEERQYIRRWIAERWRAKLR